MNCSWCKQKLPDDHVADNCIYCGHALSSPTPEPAAPVLHSKLKWHWFWLMLAGPPLLTMLSAFLARTMAVSASNESVSPTIGLLGGGLGGLAAGIFLAIKVGKTIEARVLLSLLFSAVMVVVCIMLCFFGCTVGGYEFQIR